MSGKPVESVPMLALELSRYVAGDTVRLGLLRDTETVSIDVTVNERPHPIDELVGLMDPEKNAVSTIGILGVDIADSTVGLLPALRISSGVFVAARTAVTLSKEMPLVAGDVIHAVNGFAVRSVDGLRVLIDDVKPNSDLVSRSNATANCCS